MIDNINEKLKKVYDGFKQEAELFFVTNFIDSDSIKKEYQFCLDVVLDISKSKDNTKGIIASNPKYGQGKSFFFDVTQHRYKRRLNKNLWRRVTARELCDVFTSAKRDTDPIKELDKIIRVKNLFIDDIGDELKDGGAIRVVYGNKLNVIRYVFLKRHEYWQDKGYKTFGTTNLTINQISENYGGRVADRIMQMCYWRKFQFLKEGSFRQIENSKKLTQDQIRKNWLKFSPSKKQESVDLDQYFNSMLNSSIDSIEKQSISFWELCKTYLLTKKLIKETDFELIDEAKMEASRSKLIYDKIQILRSEYRNAPSNVFKSQVYLMKKNVTTEDVKKFAECSIVKGVFLILKDQKHKF